MIDKTHNKPKTYSVVRIILWFNFLVSGLFLLLGVLILIPSDQEIWWAFREGWVNGGFGISFEQYYAEFSYYFFLLIFPLLAGLAMFYASRKSSIALILLLALFLLISIGRGTTLFMVIDLIAVTCALTESSRKYIRDMQVRG